MFPLVSVWVRQRGAWKLHPYNFVIQNCLITVIPTKPDKFEATNCYCHLCIYNNLLILTTTSPHCHTAPTNSSLHLFHSSLQQEETGTHHYTGSTMLNIFFFADHVLLNIFFLSAHFYPFFAYPALNFSQPHYPTRPYSLFSFLSTSLHALFSFFSKIIA